MSTSPTATKEPAMSTATLPSHRELAASITVNPDRLADLYRDATLEYERLLEKLDEHAGWIADKMTRLRVSIANSRQDGPTALSINGLGELQGQGPELDRLCSEVSNQRDRIRRLGEVLGIGA
jgi:DNA-binding transcriptional regulator YhcF (GntR family)